MFLFYLVPVAVEVEGGAGDVGEVGAAPEQLDVVSGDGRVVLSEVGAVGHHGGLGLL